MERKWDEIKKVEKRVKGIEGREKENGGIGGDKKRYREKYKSVG